MTISKMIKSIGVYKSENLALLALTLMSLLLGMLAVSRLIYPYDLGHLEACTWMPAWLSAGGENPYQFAKRPPFVMAPYGYLYYLLVGAGLRSFGFQLWFGRAVSVLAVIVCTVCIIRIAFLLTRNRQAAMFGALAFLSSLPLHHWIGVHRPDLPALALAVAALTLIFESSGQPVKSTAQIALVVALFVSAIFFKQTVLLPVVIASTRMWQAGRFKLATGLVVSVAAGSLLIAFLLNTTSQNEYFWQHFTLMRQIPHSYADALHWLISLFKAPATWVSFGVIVAAQWQSLRRAPGNSLSSNEVIKFLKSPSALIVIYFVAAAVFGFITSARSGAYVNYYLETFIAGSIVVALACDRLTTVSKRLALFPVLIALMTIGGIIGIARAARGELFRWQSLAYYREIVATLNQMTPPQSICISVHPELVTAAGRQYHFGDWLQYIDGRSPELHRLLIEEIASGRYEAVIWLTNDADKTILHGYHHVPMKQPPPVSHFPVFLYLRDHH